MSSQRSRAERRSRTRARLLDAASTVFARRGFEGASLNEIAEEAGFTKGAVYSNFSGKDDLFAAVLETRLTERMRAVQAAFEEAESLQDVRTSGHAIAELFAADPEVWLLFLELWMHGARDQDARRRIAAVYEEMRGTVGDLIAVQFERLDIPLPAPPPHLAAAAIALAEGHRLQRDIDPDRVGDAAYGEMLAYLVAGMAVAGLGLDVDALRRLRAEAGR